MLFAAHDAHPIAIEHLFRRLVHRLHGLSWGTLPAEACPRHLTGFYLMIAAGGALGGLFVAVVAP